MTSGTEGLLKLYEVPKSGMSVLIEDDGKVAYAYLRRGDEIVADVWLYNVGAAPDEPTWTDRPQGPFLNQKGYVMDEELQRITAHTQVTCSWNCEQVEIRVEGQLIARLQPGIKPGWSRLARRSGPLAQPLEPSSTS